MDVAFSMPDDLARRLEHRWGNLSERAREALVAEAHGVYLDYSEEDLAEDVRAARAARS